MAEEEKVTTDKPKHPGRQEWGRKLGKMQRELKLKKQINEVVIEKPVINKYIYSVKWEYALGIGALVVGAVALYYQKKSYENQVITQPVVITEKRNTQFSDF